MQARVFICNKSSDPDLVGKLRGILPGFDIGSQNTRVWSYWRNDVKFVVSRFGLHALVGVHGSLSQPNYLNAVRLLFSKL